MEIRELGQCDLIRLIMALAIPEDGKLGQVDLINSWPGDSLLGSTQTLLQPEVRYSLTVV